MTEPAPKVVVAGHLCLDLIPTFAGKVSFKEHFLPGKLIHMNGIRFSLGGAVANTGLALKKLGINPVLIGKTGKDEIGDIIVQMLNKFGDDLTGFLTRDNSTGSSYTIVLNPPGTDRLFLHFPGANDTFVTGDIPDECFKSAKHFHFGYPPAMRSMYLHDGQELASILKKAGNYGLTTSLDMSLPDKNAESGKINWRKVLQSTMPFTDIFLPSLEELIFMMKRDLYDRAGFSGVDLFSSVTPGILREIADELIQMGCKIVVIKMGDVGLYLKSGKVNAEYSVLSEEWSEREMYTPCYKVETIGTTGAGDTTIAGFLTGLLKAYKPDEVLSSAAATGACCVEQPDAYSGIMTWQEMRKRITIGWEKKYPGKIFSDWKPSGTVWLGPNDRFKN